MTGLWGTRQAHLSLFGASRDNGSGRRPLLPSLAHPCLGGWHPCLPSETVSQVFGEEMLRSGLWFSCSGLGRSWGLETARAIASGIGLLVLGPDPICSWAVGSCKTPKLEPAQTVGGWVSEKLEAVRSIPVRHPSPFSSSLDSWGLRRQKSQATFCLNIVDNLSLPAE